MNDLTPAERTLPEAGAKSQFEAEMAELLVEVLHLEIAPAAILSEEPLFHDGLGLDSIDALELALALSKRYGVRLHSDDPRGPQIFASLRSLSRFIAAERST